MRFLCDHMLVRLGRWLRAAGYDTAIPEGGQSDQQILEQAKRENRLLITRDRHFSEIDEKTVLFLESNDVESCALELATKVTIDWLKAPFSRCTVCNTELEKASKEVEVPEGVESNVLWCSSCEKAFWQGSHTRRMHDTLKRWNDLEHP